MKTESESPRQAAEVFSGLEHLESLLKVKDMLLGFST